MKSTVVFVADGRAIWFDNILYGFSHTFPPSFLVVSETESISSTNIIPFKSTEQILSSIKLTQVRKNQIIDPRFSILPSFAQINTYITTTNVNSLIQVIRTVEAIDLNCI